MKAAQVYKAILQIIGCCFIVVLCSAAPALAQTRGKVEVIKDARIDTFAVRRAELNKSADETTVNGYRLQIFSGTNRKEAYNAQATFAEQFPDIHAYVIYTEPNFKVRVGDFRTRLEADKLKEDLNNKFVGMFVIPEKINPPKQDNKNE